MLRRKAEGHTIGWLIMTGMLESTGWPADSVRTRDAEIAEVANLIGVDTVWKLNLPPARLDALPMADIVARVAAVIQEFRPAEVYVPYRGDVHSDHHVTFDAVTACTKWFRHPSVQRILSYETPSETDFGLAPGASFTPTVFMDISRYLERKLEIISVYASELGVPPFPRSVDGLRALGKVRGAASGFPAAEAFQLLRERQ